MFLRLTEKGLKVAGGIQVLSRHFSWQEVKMKKKPLFSNKPKNDRL
jgi:hypothetical protein